MARGDSGEEEVDEVGGVGVEDGSESGEGAISFRWSFTHPGRRQHPPVRWTLGVEGVGRWAGEVDGVEVEVEVEAAAVPGCGGSLVWKRNCSMSKGSCHFVSEGSFEKSSELQTSTEKRLLKWERWQKKKGGGSQEWSFTQMGVEWSAVTWKTICGERCGRRRRRGED